MRLAPVTVTLALLALTLLPAVAQAGHTPTCTSGGALVNGGAAYVTHAGTTGLWVETNGVPGLQRSACTHNGQHVPADTRIPPEILGLCIFGVPVVSGCY